MKPRPVAKSLANTLGWIVALFWLGFAGLSVAYLLAGGRAPGGPELFGYRFMAVLSDSMAPKVRSGDMVIGRQPVSGEIAVGQIVTYRMPWADYPVTHRVIEIRQQGSETLLITQGDANSVPDIDPVPARMVVAVYRFHIPYGGYLLAFGRSKVGLAVLVIIPSFLLMGSELTRLTRYFGSAKRAEAQK